jgi:hypothetical protein
MAIQFKRLNRFLKIFLKPPIFFLLCSKWMGKNGYKPLNPTFLLGCSPDN